MTRYLNFSEDFTENILKGEKLSTLRLGVKDYSPKESVLVRCGNKVIGEAIIREVRLRRFKDLTEEDAKMDGFENLSSLRNTLERFYGKFDDEQIFTQIIFELCKINER